MRFKEKLCVSNSMEICVIRNTVLFRLNKLLVMCHIKILVFTDKIGKNIMFDFFYTFTDKQFARVSITLCSEANISVI